jgi:hypothetical protein
MRMHEKHVSIRTLGAVLAAATVALPVAVSALLPGKVDALVPFALMLPFVTMGLLDAALNHDRHARG